MKKRKRAASEKDLNTRTRGRKKSNDKGQKKLMCLVCEALTDGSHACTHCTQGYGMPPLVFLQTIRCSTCIVTSWFITLIRLLTSHVSVVSLVSLQMA